ncbi:MAG: universal stress protein [Candidatus Synoicihabitans palmerolidicus]|nr:universal stress protein [Candidatus Synoicihabitans palmerolidicus]
MYSRRIKTILTPVDFSPATALVIDAAIELAHAVNGKVELLHATQPPTADYGLAMENVQEIISVSEKASRQQLEHLLRRISDRGVACTSVSTHGPAVSGIVEQAKQLEASYVVMGSHGHTALYDLLVGSTTHGVLKKTPCPALSPRFNLSSVVGFPSRERSIRSWHELRCVDGIDSFTC